LPFIQIEAAGACQLPPGSRWTHNPLMWMAEVNGDPENLRDMLRKIHKIAFETGMIPHIPDHRE
jgi:hypothetical protein